MHSGLPKRLFDLAAGGIGLATWCGQKAANRVLDVYRELLAAPKQNGQRRC